MEHLALFCFCVALLCVFGVLFVVIKGQLRLQRKIRVIEVQIIDSNGRGYGEGDGCVYGYGAGDGYEYGRGNGDGK